MKTIANDTAVLLFSRTASAEARAKDFFGVKSLKQNRRLAEYFLRQSLCTAKKTSLPFFHITEKEQRGNFFGERLANAVQDVFCSGFQKVIIIGNDAPSLMAEDIQSAIARLQTASLVFTPTAKGGVSMIAIAKEAFCKEAFCFIAWQTNKVANELVAYAAIEQLTVSILDQRDDINGYADIIKQLSIKAGFCSFHNFLRSLIASLKRFFSAESFAVYQDSKLYYTGLRAPPFC